MRVALVCPYAWDDPGGVQVHVRELGERLRARDHQVLALTPARVRPREPWVVGIGAPLDVPYNASNAPVAPWPGARRRVREGLTAFAPDVVHAHEPLAPSASLFALTAGAAPVVATFHSGAERSRLFDAAAPVLRRVARRIDVRIAVSERAAEFARARVGGSWLVIPNGADVDRFRGATPADLGPGRAVLFVGRLDERKGFPTAVRAFARLAADDADLRLVVAGDGPDRAAVDTLPAEIRGRVRLLGTLANAELPPIHAACDAFIAPSVGGESFGIVLVEAMAAGLPVVASDIPGYDEVVTHETDGLLVPPRDPEAAAAALRRILGDPALAQRLVEAGRRRAATFDWSAVVVRLEAAYLQAAGGLEGSLR